MDEFALIERYFGNVGRADADTLLAVGDDAAVVQLPPGRQLVLSIDTLVAGVHFTEDTDPADIAYKALAVNLSDLAAMAATPAWFLLSLTLPRSDDRWLNRFAGGLSQTSEAFGLQLIGGDTCRGPLSITIQIGGTVPSGAYVTRAGARTGDLVLVSGELGNAALGLARRQGRVDLPREFQSRCDLALDRPRPRLELAPFLREFAHAAIDISDGLQADLGHILEASGRGATLRRELLPVDPWVRAHDGWDYALGGGDDYEICCCAAAQCQSEVEDWNRAHPDCTLSPIGEITAEGYYLVDGETRVDLSSPRGYRHFD